MGINDSKIEESDLLFIEQRQSYSLGGDYSLNKIEKLDNIFVLGKKSKEFFFEIDDRVKFIHPNLMKTLGYSNNYMKGYMNIYFEWSHIPLEKFINNKIKNRKKILEEDILKLTKGKIII